MKKRSIIVAVSAIAALLLVVGAASAFMGIGKNAKGNFGQHHETMEKIMEEGKYSDLVAYREESGLNIMPMAADEQSFQDMQEMHKTMEGFHEKYGSGMGKGMGGMQGMMGSKSGMGCPMMG